MINQLLRASITMLLFLFSFTTYAENTSFTTSHFSGSGNCATCHDGLTDTSGENVSIARDWGTSMMANATKDPFWQAKVATELNRNPHLSTLINDTCTRCHAPMANYEITKVQGGDLTLFGADGILNPDHALYDASMNGVSCTVCHQIMDDGTLGTPQGFSGHYSINDTKTIYGQFNDIFGQPMINNTGYTPIYSAHVSDSAMCATCHNLKTPFVDALGNVVASEEAGFPEQMPYTEWQQSVFDDAGSNPQSCQDCHMPKTTSKVSNRPRWLGTKDGFAKHELVGANTTMLTLLRNNAAQLDVTSPNLDLGIERARAMLQSAASVEIVSASVNNGTLEAHVKVQNHSGHKAPTAYPSRRMWLHFKVTDSNNNVVFESGRINADGSIDGADNDVNQAVFEPHYNQITSADQVQIYETVMADSDSNITYTLLRGARYLKDNRLTPQGFNKLNVPSDVAVLGQAADDTDFNLGSDEISYSVSVANAAAGDLNVSVSLNYQTIAHGFLQDLYRDDHLQQVQTFKTLYDAQSLKHEQVASAQTTVISDGGGTPAPAPTVTLSVSPVSATIDSGQTVTLSWVSTDATSCSAIWTNSMATSDSAAVTPGATATYTMICSGDGGTASDSLTVTVNAPPVPAVTLSVASPASGIIDQGQSATLSWSSTNATSCTAGWATSNATSGSATVTPDATSAYTMTCNGAGGSASDSVTVTVNAAPTVTAPTVILTASPSRVSRGSTITLNWSSTDANSCTASGDWSGTKASAGSEPIAISSAVTFTLSCSGDGGSASGSVSYGTRGRRWLELR
mgnify:CR=1 FL=1